MNEKSTADAARHAYSRNSGTSMMESTITDRGRRHQMPVTSWHITLSLDALSLPFKMPHAEGPVEPARGGEILRWTSKQWSLVETQSMSVAIGNVAGSRSTQRTAGCRCVMRADTASACASSHGATMRAHGSRATGE